MLTCKYFEPGVFARNPAFCRKSTVFHSFSESLFAVNRHVSSFIFRARNNTRNQVTGNRPWVRIPPLPSCVPYGFCRMAFLCPNLFRITRFPQRWNPFSSTRTASINTSQKPNWSASSSLPTNTQLNTIPASTVFTMNLISEWCAGKAAYNDFFYRVQLELLE